MDLLSYPEDNKESAILGVGKQTWKLFVTMFEFPIM